MKKAAFPYLLILLGPLAAQANAPFCLPFASLKLSAENCDDNFALGKQADACLSAYTKAITAKRAEIEQMLKSEVNKGVAQQSGTMNTAGTVFDHTVKELEQLILNGEQAKLAVSSLGSNLSLPEDYDQPQVTGMSTAKYLSVEPCYATPKRVVDENVAVLQLMVEDLKKTKNEVLAKNGVVQAGAQGLQGSVPGSQGITAGRTAPVPSALPKESNVKNRESDVSGTIKPDALAPVQK